jgi:hypothetical protein
MNKKELQICSFEQAKALKELGFDWLSYGSVIYIPTRHDSSYKVNGQNCYLYYFMAELESNDYTEPLSYDFSLRQKPLKEIVIANNSAMTGLYQFDRFPKADVLLIQPTVALALQWCREVKGVKNEVRFYYVSDAYESYYYQGYFDIKNHKVVYCTKHYEIYQSAESALLDEIIKQLSTAPNCRTTA